MVFPDPALGIDVDFPSLDVTNGIRFAMQLGRNPDASRAIKFITPTPNSRSFWKNNVEVVPDPPVDRDGNPLDPDIEVRFPAESEILDTDGDGNDIPVDCAIEVEPRDALETPVGNFRPTKVVVTLLAPQYALVKECRRIRYNGDEYLYGYEPESVGLFDLAAHTIIYYALDES